MRMSCDLMNLAEPGTNILDLQSRHESRVPKLPVPTLGTLEYNKLLHVRNVLVAFKHDDVV